jgi:hypothetical protein
MIPPAAQRVMSKRAGSTVVEVAKCAIWRSQMRWLLIEAAKGLKQRREA